MIPVRRSPRNSSKVTGSNGKIKHESPKITQMAELVSKHNSNNQESQGLPRVRRIKRAPVSAGRIKKKTGIEDFDDSVMNTVYAIKEEVVDWEFDSNDANNSDEGKFCVRLDHSYAHYDGEATEENVPPSNSDKSKSHSQQGASSRSSLEEITLKRESDDSCNQVSNLADKSRQKAALPWLGKPVKLTPCKVDPSNKSVLWAVTPVRLLHCGLCTETFESHKELQQHQDMHIAQTALKRIPAATNKKPLMKKEKESQKERFSCDVCMKSFHSLSYMKEHRKMHTGEGVRCKLCTKQFMNKKLLKKHWATHLGIKRYACDLCSKKFVNKTSLAIHKQAHLNIRPFQCHVCSKSFLTKASLGLHEQRHFGKRHQCDECGKRFSTIWALNYHTKSHADSKELQCEYCGKQFSCPPVLARHLKTHNEERHQCHLCPRSYKERRHLIEHTKLHTGVGVLKCETCGKAFTRKRDFEKHIECHKNGKKLGPRVFQCDACGKQFPSIYRLKMHFSTHMDLRPFECEDCHKTFSRKYYLLKHRRLHTGEKKHACKLCDRKFTWHSSLKKHLIAHSRKNQTQEVAETNDACLSFNFQLVAN